VTAEVQVSVIPSWLGTTQIRQVRFHGPDRLALSVSQRRSGEVMTTTSISWARQPPR
jgi:hypothetical protein